MFRIVSEFVPKPAFLLLCDHPHCGNVQTNQFDATPATDIKQLSAAFIEQAIATGWAIGLDRQICPAHVKASQQQQKLIEIPRLYLPTN